MSPGDIAKPQLLCMFGRAVVVVNKAGWPRTFRIVQIVIANICVAKVARWRDTEWGLDSNEEWETPFTHYSKYWTHSLTYLEILVHLVYLTSHNIVLGKSCLAFYFVWWRFRFCLQNFLRLGHFIWDTYYIWNTLDGCFFVLFLFF